MGQVQTRNEDGELCWFDTLDKALAHAHDDPTVWKVSFAIDDAVNSRARLVRAGDGWVLEQLMDAVLERLGEDRP